MNRYEYIAGELEREAEFASVPDPRYPEWKLVNQHTLKMLAKQVRELASDWHLDE